MDFKELIQTVNLRKGLEERLEKAKALFEEQNAFDFALLEDYKAKEEQLRTEALEEMKNSHQENLAVDDFTITRNTKYTNQIKDTARLKIAIQANKAEILALGVSEEDVNNLFKTEEVIVDKKLATSIVNNLEKINNTLLDGCEKKATEFITIAKQTNV